MSQKPMFAVDIYLIEEKLIARSRNHELSQVKNLLLFLILIFAYGF